MVGGGIADLAREDLAVLAEKVHVGVTAEFATHGLNESHWFDLAHTDSALFSLVPHEWIKKINLNKHCHLAWLWRA